MPLRERLERSVADGDGDNDGIARRARGLPRVEDATHRRAARRRVPRWRTAGHRRRRSSPGTPTLVGDPDGPPSPDCEDNTLAGAVTAGEPVPVGAYCSPPMHTRVPLPPAAFGRVASARAATSSDNGGYSRRRISGRGVLIGVGVVFLLVVVFGRAVARFYVDYLWHDGARSVRRLLGRHPAPRSRCSSCSSGVRRDRRAQPADRRPALADPFPANVHPYVERFHELFGHRLRLLRYAVAGCSRSWWRCRPRRSGSRGCCSATASRSASARRPVRRRRRFLRLRAAVPSASCSTGCCVAMMLVLLLTVLTHVLNGGVVFASPVPSVRPATKGHIAVLLAVLAVAQGRRLLGRAVRDHERATRLRAGRDVRRRQRPAAGADAADADRAAHGRALPRATIRRASWRLPLIASALWFVVAVVGGLVYPALVQSLVVNPNQQSREAPYIDRNVEATREAMGHQHRRRRRSRPSSSVRSTAADVERRPRPAARTSACSTRTRCCRGSASIAASRPA